MLANLVTLSRIFFGFLAITVFHFGSVAGSIAAVLLVSFAFFTDYLDGMVARKTNQSSIFGSQLDVAADRALELTIWIYFSTRGALPFWFPIAFAVRGILVDLIRSSNAARGNGVYNLIHIPFFTSLTTGRLFRGSINTLKCALSIFLFAMPIVPSIWMANYSLVIQSCMWACLSLNILRALPVFVDFFSRRRASGALL